MKPRYALRKICTRALWRGVDARRSIIIISLILLFREEQNGFINHALPRLVVDWSSYMCWWATYNTGFAVLGGGKYQASHSSREM